MKRLIFDGGMGTALYALGLEGDPARFNLSHPAQAADIHRQYLEAGADVITANTFGAYTHKHSDADDIIAAALTIAQQAREACNIPHALVALDLSPTGLLLEPYGETTADEVRAFFTQAVQAGVRRGADIILAETFFCLTELEQAVNAAMESGLPVFATMTFNEKGRTTMGVSLAQMALKLQEWGVAAAGMNCGTGTDAYIKLLPELREATDLPLLIQPNAGLPEFVNGRTRYNVTPQEFARAMKEISALGGTHLGGCCGTTPAHIAAMAAACAGA